MDIKDKIKIMVKVWGENTNVFDIYPKLKEALEELLETEEQSEKH